MRALADEVGVDIGHLSRVLTGKKPVSVSLIQRAADALGFAPDECSEYRLAVVTKALGQDVEALDPAYELLREHHPQLHADAVVGLGRNGDPSKV